MTHLNVQPGTIFHSDNLPVLRDMNSTWVGTGRLLGRQKDAD